jgi:TFIIF-interacting CTD phosphatase-like protein
MSEVLFTFHSPRSRYTGKGPKTLILDLDETLIHSWENSRFIDTYKIYTDPTIYRRFHPLGTPQIAYSMLLDMNGSLNRIWGLHRPYLYEFLSFAGQYFDNIIVWSAGIRPYVDEITKQIFLESGLQPPKIVWSRNKCSNYQGLYHKPISEINAELATRPYETFTIDPKSTLILDDKQHTFMENPQNGILIRPYHPGKNRPEKFPTMEDLLDRSDKDLLQFMRWLERPEVRNAEDVRSLDKTNIFK